MAYTPPRADTTVISGALIPISASGSLTWGREHLVSGAAAVSGSITATTTSGATLELKVAAGYTGSGVTVTPPSGVTIDGAASFGPMTAGQSNQFTFDGTNIVVE